MNNPTTFCIAGCSGLVGSELLNILSNVESVQKIVAISRSPLGRIPARAENIIVNFDHLEKYTKSFQAHVFICCLGTTLKQAGSKKNFETVDFDYCLSFAKIAQEVGAQKLLLITAMGSDPHSLFYYSRIKGRLENEVRRLNIPQIEIFRPSLILGNRKTKRPLEDFAQKLSPIFDVVLRGPLKKYRSIKAENIAKAMAVASLNFNPGLYIYDSLEIQRIADGVKSFSKIKS